MTKVYTNEEKLNVLTEKDKFEFPNREDQLALAEIIMWSVPQNPDNYKLGSMVTRMDVGLPPLEK